MLKLNRQEVTDLRIVAALNRGTKEIETLHDSLLYDLMHHDFIKQPIVSVSIPMRTLEWFTKYTDDWDKNDTLGIALKAEYKKRTTKQKQI